MIGYGTQHQVCQPLRKQPMHHLIRGMTVDLGHHVLISAHTVGNAVGEVQLVFVAHLRTENIIQCFDDF